MTMVRSPRWRKSSRASAGTPTRVCGSRALSTREETVPEAYLARWEFRLSNRHTGRPYRFSARIILNSVIGTRRTGIRPSSLWRSPNGTEPEKLSRSTTSCVLIGVDPKPKRLRADERHECDACDAADRRGTVHNDPLS